MAERLKRHLFILLLGLLLPGTASGAGLEWGGHFKSLNIRLQSPPRNVFPSGEISSNNLRLDLRDTIRRDIAWEASVENLLRYTNPAGLLRLPRDSANRLLDLEKNWNETGHLQNHLFVDRLNLRATLARVEWTLGRQSIGFGRIALFSPLDIIAPFAPDALDTDVRPGVDALRAVRYFGLGGQVGATAVFAEAPDSRSYLLTGSHNISTIDLLGITGELRDREMGGFGLAGSLGGLGVKLEAAHYQGKTGDLHESFAMAAAESWYRFDNGLILLLEYLYNGAGTGRAAEYPKAAAAATHREGLSFLLGRQYLLAAPAYEIHPLLTLNGLLIWNLRDDSFLVRPLLDVSLADEIVLQLFWSFNVGTAPSSGPVPGTLLPRSEFGSAADSGGLFLKYYF